MPGQYLFEYAVIRVVPHVEREEFINAGVVLYCAGEKFLRAAFVLNQTRLLAFCPALNIEDVKQYLLAFERTCLGGPAAGNIGMLPPPERFRWLTATRSTILQTSKVHPGFCADAATMLQKLFNEIVC